MKLFLLMGVLFLAACGGSSDKKTTEQADSAKAPELVLKWESDSSLKVPESVLFDKAAQVLYVSNIDGTNPWEADGKGSIGKVGLDGKVIAAEWVSGLHGPKGMGMFNGKLYVADLGNIVVIDWSDTGECHENTGVHRSSGRIYEIGVKAEKHQEFKEFKASNVFADLTSDNIFYARRSLEQIADNPDQFKVLKSDLLELLSFF